jgi:hypothetical protein
MDLQGIADAVEEVGRLLRADGADLLLVEADPKTLRIRLCLRLDSVDCTDCVLPPGELAQTIAQAIRTRVRGEFELLIDDPRVA